MGFLGQGLKQLFQQQRKRLSLSRPAVTSSSSSSSSSVVSAGGVSLCAPDDAPGRCCPDSDRFSAPVVPFTAGKGSAAAGMMRRGTSLQSRRSKGSSSGSGNGDRDPLLRGSPQAPVRRHTHDPQQHVSRPRSSSTESAPSSPAPTGVTCDVLLSSGYQSTEETDRVSDSSHSHVLLTLNIHWRLFIYLFLSKAVCMASIQRLLLFILVRLFCFTYGLIIQPYF